MNPSLFLRLCVLSTCVPVALSACAASNGQLAAERPEHLTTDGERYAAAVAEGYSSYVREAEAAAQMTFASEAEAEALVSTLGPRRLDFHLARALARRGLTPRGMSVYAQHHPGFVHGQRAAHSAELDRATALVASLESRVEYRGDAPEATPSQLAAR